MKGDSAPAVVKLGVRTSNTKTRHGDLSGEQLAQLSALGLDRA